MDMNKPDPRANLSAISPEDGPIALVGDEILEFGLGWDIPGKDKSAKGFGRKAWKALSGEADDSDADAIAVAFTRNKPIAYAGLDQRDPWHGREGAGSMTSDGDAKTGEEAAEGDDETLKVDLSKLPARVDKVLVTCGAYKKGADQKEIRNMIATIYNSSGGTKTPMAFVEPSLLRPKHMMIIGVLERIDGVWYFRAVDESFNITQGSMDSLLTVVPSVAGRTATA
jgi:tellurium resistance protein TerD